MKYIAVTAPDINNGLGCRVTLWVAGCSHHCSECHNPETWDYNIGKSLEDIQDELYSWLSKPYIKGLTLSGGDPLAQNEASLNELIDLLNDIHKNFPEKDIWLYTGYYLKDIQNDELKIKIVDMCDVIVDGPYIKELRDLSLPFRGSSNQTIHTKDKTIKI